MDSINRYIKDMKKLSVLFSVFIPFQVNVGFFRTPPEYACATVTITANTAVRHVT